MDFTYVGLQDWNGDCAQEPLAYESEHLHIVQAHCKLVITSNGVTLDYDYLSGTSQEIAQMTLKHIIECFKYLLDILHDIRYNKY